MGIVVRGPARRNFREILRRAIEDLGPAGRQLVEEYRLLERLDEIDEEEASRILRELMRRGLVKKY